MNMKVFQFIFLFSILFILIFSLGCTSSHVVVGKATEKTSVGWTFCTAYGPGPKAGMEPGVYWGYAFAISGDDYYLVEEINMKDDGTKKRKDEFRSVLYDLIDTYYSTGGLQKDSLKLVGEAELRFKKCSGKELSKEQVKELFSSQLT